MKVYVVSSVYTSDDYYDFVNLCVVASEDDAKKRCEELKEDSETGWKYVYEEFEIE